MFTITNGIILKGQDLTLKKENIVVDEGKIVEIGKESLFLDFHGQREFLINRRRIENTKESANDHLINLGAQGRKGIQISEPLPRRDDGIVIRDLLVINISRPGNALITAILQNLIGISRHQAISL